MSGQAYWQNKIAGIERNLAGVRERAGEIDGERRALALAREDGDRGASRKHGLIEREVGETADKIRNLVLARAEAEAQLAEARDAERAAEARSRNKCLHALVAKRAGAVARLEDHLRAVARELDAMGELAAEIVKLRPAKTRAEAVDGPLDPDRVCFRLQVFCGFIGLHKWLTEDVNAYCRREVRTLADLEADAHARYLAG